MERHFSRLARFEEKKALRRLFLAIAATVVIILSLVFLGIPALVKFSLFIGNLKSGQETTEQQQNTIAPFPPHLETPYLATNSAKITISGYAQPKTTVEVFLNGNSLNKILLGSDGQFTLPNVILSEGENKLTASSKDSAGNVSQLSNPLIIIYKKKPPVLKLTQPEDGKRISGEEKEILVSGLTEPEVSLSINGRLVTVKNDGSFAYSFSLVPGENLIKIIATDNAGNQTIVERKVTFTP